MTLMIKWAQLEENVQEKWTGLLLLADMSFKNNDERNFP